MNKIILINNKFNKIKVNENENFFNIMLINLIK